MLAPVRCYLSSHDGSRNGRTEQERTPPNPRAHCSCTIAQYCNQSRGLCVFGPGKSRTGRIARSDCPLAAQICCLVWAALPRRPIVRRRTLPRTIFLRTKIHDRSWRPPGCGRYNDVPPLFSGQRWRERRRASTKSGRFTQSFSFMRCTHPCPPFSSQTRFAGME
jgi:hypothetical protein